MRFEGDRIIGRQTGNGSLRLQPVDVPFPGHQVVVLIPEIIMQMKMNVPEGVQIKNPFVEGNFPEHTVMAEIETVDQPLVVNFHRQSKGHVRGRLGDVLQRNHRTPAFFKQTQEKFGGDIQPTFELILIIQGVVFEMSHDQFGIPAIGDVDDRLHLQEADGTHVGIEGSRGYVHKRRVKGMSGKPLDLDSCFFKLPTLELLECVGI